MATCVRSCEQGANPRWDASRAEAPPRCPQHSADGGWCKNGVSWSTAGVPGDLAADLHEAGLVVTFVLSMGRWCTVPLVNWVHWIACRDRGGGVRGQPFPSWEGYPSWWSTCVETAHQVPSFNAMQESRSAEVTPEIFCIGTGLAGEVTNGDVRWDRSTVL